MIHLIFSDLNFLNNKKYLKMIKVLIFATLLYTTVSIELKLVDKRYHAVDCTDNKTTEFCSIQNVPQPAYCVRIKYFISEIGYESIPKYEYSHQCLPWREVVQEVEVTEKNMLHTYMHTRTGSVGNQAETKCTKDANCLST